MSRRGRKVETTKPARDVPDGPPKELLTLVSVARWRAENQPDDLAFTFLNDGEQAEDNLSYAELDRRARAVAEELCQCGAQGERVLLLFEPGLDYLAAMYGCLYAGAMAVPIYPPDPMRLGRTLSRAHAIIRNARAKFVLGAESITRSIADQLDADQLDKVRLLTLPLFDSSPQPNGQPPNGQPTVDDPSELALLQYTSGSTGTPKGVMISHGNLMHNLRAMHELDSDGVVGVSWLPPYHDFGLIGGVLLPVYSGRRTVLMSPLSFVQRPMRWLWAIANYGARTTGGPNFAYELCVRKMRPNECRDLDLSCWKIACVGAEPVRAEMIERFAETFGPYGFRREAFLPGFGLAESVLRVSCGLWREPPSLRHFSAEALQRNRAQPAADQTHGTRRLVGCGRPMPGDQVAIVDPKTTRRLPSGEVGEIWVQSRSVGQGYWDRAEESDRIFRARISGEEDGTFLRTGDLGFLHEDELFVTGRLKELIVLGGRNYYPQDIEKTVARAHKALRPNASAAFSCEVDGRERLVVVQEGRRSARFDMDDILASIRRELGQQYLISPHAVVLVPGGSLPKTSSGKLRRRTCRRRYMEGQLRILAQWRAAPEGQSSETVAQFVAPRTPLEQQIAVIWADVLQLPRVGLHDSFFAHGGNSLLAVELAMRLRELAGGELPLDRLFQRPTVAGLAALIQRQDQPEGATSACPPIPTRDAKQPPMLSSAERRLWFVEQLQPGRPLYNLPAAVKITGPLNEDLFEQSLQHLARRHEILRTVFETLDGQPTRRILDEITLPVTRVEVSERELQEQLRDHALEPFDLTTGPLLRCVVLRLSENERVVLMVMHHIISDGWSMGLLLRDLTASYEALASGKAPSLPRPAITCADFATWQQDQLTGPAMGRHGEYWKARLGDLPARLQLPTDRPRPAEPTYEGATVEFRWSAELSQRVRRFARRERTTPFVVLLAAWKVVLSRYCRQEDVTVGTAVAGRTRPELEGLVGFFVNTLALRTDMSGDPTFRQVVRRVGETVSGALAHQELPFERLVELLHPKRDPSQAPLLNVSLVMQNMPLAFPDNEEVKVEPMHVDTPAAQHDVTLFCWEREGRFCGHAEYATALFEPATIQRLLGSLATLLESGVEDLDMPARRLPIVDPAERQRLLAEFASSEQTTPQAGGCLHELFERHARSAPDRTAVRCGGRDHTYGQLDEMANRLVGRLHSLGVEPEQPVAVCLPRSVELVGAMLGIMKAGGVYLPIDPQQPTRRLNKMLDDARPAVVVTQQSLIEKFAATAAQVLTIEQIAGEPCEVQPLRPGPRPEQLAYMIYTSGSTGRPKGVLIEHRGAVNFVRAQGRVLGVTPEARILQFFSPAFDGSIAEMFSALAHGACLVIGTPDDYLAPDALEELISREQVTVSQFTPSMLRVLRPDGVESLETIVSAGEALDSQLVARWAPGRWFFNAYGPTEATIGACMARLDGPIGYRPTIGRPLENVRIYVLDEQLQPVPIGVPGEICIGGIGVARGYLGRPELSAQRFTANPFAKGRIYRTGDLGRWLDDGNLQCLGRLDDQVKLRGYRVEPGEVAAVLEEHADVQQAVVTAREDASGSNRLAAYVVPKPARADNSLETEHFDYWRTLIDGTLRQTPPPSDPTFHPAGWVSARTGRPFPHEEMRQWVDHHVGRILALRPRHVLEIGCKTGMLLFRVAPHCESYTATDFCGETLDWLRSAVQRKDELRDRVTLHERTPDQLDDLPPGRFDLVVLNSIVQFCPSLDYLLRVLHRAEKLVAPGGRLVIGDVRNLALAAPLACSIEAARADQQTTCRQLLERIERRMKQEQELLVDPAWFETLTTRLDRLDSAEVLPKPEVLPKQGPAASELVQYRFDVVLHFDQPPAQRTESVSDWSAPISEDLALWQQLQAADPETTLGQLRDMDAAKPGVAGAKRSGAPDSENLPSGASLRSATSHPTSATSHPASANNPLATAASRRLMGTLREHLAQRLPDYMMPASIVVLDALPQTPQGKLDRQALPTPAGERPEGSADYVAPRDDEEELVAHVWEWLLGVSPVGVKDDFFELGGHSMLAVRMVAAIERETGRRLPLAALFQQATVEHLARLLREPDACPAESSLIPLGGQGTGRPFFAVHPAGGTVFCYQPLAEHLGSDRPVYGLQAVGIDGVRPPHDDAQQMAAHYAAAIQTVQPQGPYLIGGWSLGGNLAFETARQLAQQGHEIGLLALIDCGALPPEREPSEDDFLPVIMDLFPGGDDLSLEDLRRMSPEEHQQYFIARATQAGIILPPSASEVGTHVFDVFKGNLQAMWEYRPRPYPGKITLFASEHQPAGIDVARDPMLGWGAWAGEGVELHPIPGRHLDMIKEPTVRILAEKIRQCIEQAEEGNRP